MHSHYIIGRVLITWLLGPFRRALLGSDFGLRLELINGVLQGNDKGRRVCVCSRDLVTCVFEWKRSMSSPDWKGFRGLGTSQGQRQVYPAPGVEILVKL